MQKYAIFIQRFPRALKGADGKPTGDYAPTFRGIGHVRALSGEGAIAEYRRTHSAAVAFSLAAEPVHERVIL